MSLDDTIGDKYILTKKYLGGGAFGSVFLGYDEHKNKYAIKQIVPQEGHDVNTFKNEINILKELSYYPKCNKHIVCLYDVYITKAGVIYLVMELVDGANISNSIPSENLLRQCAIALEYIHRKNIIHRDIKPENVMVTNNGVVKFVDFGTGCSITPLHNIDLCEKISGTRLFLDPQFLTQEIKTACKNSDIFSLGATFFELMTNGNPPAFGAKNQAIVYEDIKDRINGTKYIRNLKTIVIAMMNPNGKLRPSTTDILNFLDTGSLNITGYTKDCKDEKSPIIKKLSDSPTTKEKKLLDFIKKQALELKQEEFDELDGDVMTSDEEFINLALKNIQRSIDIPPTVVYMARNMSLT